MSVVTGVMVICSVAEADNETDRAPVLVELDEWLINRGFSGLTAVEDTLSGTKHPQFFAAGAGFNWFDDDEFAEFFMSREWDVPYQAVLVMQHEDQRTRIVRADEH